MNIEKKRKRVANKLKAYAHSCKILVADLDVMHGVVDDCIHTLNAAYEDVNDENPFHKDDQSQEWGEWINLHLEPNQYHYNYLARRIKDRNHRIFSGLADRDYNLLNDSFSAWSHKASLYMFDFERLDLTDHQSCGDYTDDRFLQDRIEDFIWQLENMSKQILDGMYDNDLKDELDLKL